MKGRLCAILVLTCLPLQATAFFWSQTPPVQAPPPRPVASMRVTDDSPQTQSVPGAITARLQVELAFQTLGRMTARNFDVGDVVTKGQVLATLDPEDLQAQVNSATAAADAAEVDLQTAAATASRVRALARRNVATTAQLEQAERALAAAQAADQRARSELIQARDAEKYAEMQAPFDGVISAVRVAPGAVVTAGEPVMTLSAQDGLEAVIDLQAPMLSRIRIGDAFDIWSEQHPESRQTARVARIEPVADAATRTRRVRLELASDQGFRLGALIRARPMTGGLRQITVPLSALVQRDGQSHVWVVTRDGRQGTVSLRPIETQGPDIAGLIAVSAGLRPGEEVVIRGTQSLADDQPVGESVAP